MRLTVLSVAYPFAPVLLDCVGGAEQILAQIDRGLVHSGHRSVILAQENSSAAGELIPIPKPAGEITDEVRELTYVSVRALLEAACRRFRPDAIHFHGLDFDEYLPEDGPQKIATLHLPLSWYPDQVFNHDSSVWLVPVSRDQAQRGGSPPTLLAPIENGVELDVHARRTRKAAYALSLGRICPEKGFHLALNAAAAADIPMILAGEVFPYRSHRSYFEREIAPRLGARAKWLGAVRGARKTRLLARAQCLLAPSLVPETSSLVGREALAAGTPIVAFRNGAIVEIVKDGQTGYLVDSPEQLPDAIRACSDIDPEICRKEAARFSLARMVDAYISLYAAAAAGVPSLGQAPPLAPCASQ